ncbi:MAG: hypothetical protein ACI91Z_001502, partial [Yoonia sp.]
MCRHAGVTVREYDVSIVSWLLFSAFIEKAIYKKL